MQTVVIQPDLQTTIIYVVGENDPMPNIDFGWPQHGRLAYFAGNSIVVSTGATFGVTRVTSDFTDDAPSFDPERSHWETVEEGSLTIAAKLELVPHGPPDERAVSQIPIVNVEPGTYMARISSFGRDPERNDVRIHIELWRTSVNVGLLSLKVGDRFDPNSITSVIAQRHAPPADSITALGLPRSDRPLLIRTDFSSDPSWDGVVSRVQKPVLDVPGVEFTADERPISETRYDGANVSDLFLAAEASGNDAPFFILVADSTTFADSECTILAIDLHENPGATVRIPPEHV